MNREKLMAKVSEIKQEQVKRDESLENIRTLIRDLGEAPTLANFRKFLSALKEQLEV